MESDVYAANRSDFSRRQQEMRGDKKIQTVARDR